MATEDVAGTIFWKDSDTAKHKPPRRLESGGKELSNMRREIEIV